jgi:hypothetical protein
MSDQDTGQEPIAETEVNTEVAEAQEVKEPKVFDESYVKELRAEAAKNRKAAQEAQAILQEREDAEKSELERAQGKLAKTEKELAEARTVLLRNEVADELEVPSKLRPLLTGASKEDLEAQARLIIENATKPEEPTFDGGPRDPSPDPKTPEGAHSELIAGLFGGKST